MNRVYECVRMSPLTQFLREVQEEQTPESDSQTHTIIIGASVGGGLLLVVLVVVIVVLKMRQRKSAEDAYVAYTPSRKSDGSTYAELNF
ncbi:hypothetical protein FSP39_023563 [Pinctada imbricata]|uniref:Uncharacterized protein n=1 Tax=Pinctada imbricata TaxID=66713 RepID=A0AA88XE26_PINIB|nr:hypothetical protein FSP39_023563 [Pinctada imbricata]